MHKRTTTLHAIGPQALLSSSLGFVFVSRLFHIDDEVWQSRISHIDDVLTILTILARNDVSTDNSCYDVGWTLEEIRYQHLQKLLGCVTLPLYLITLFQTSSTVRRIQIPCYHRYLSGWWNCTSKQREGSRTTRETSWMDDWYKGLLVWWTIIINRFPSWNRVGSKRDGWVSRLYDSKFESNYEQMQFVSHSQQSIHQSIISTNQNLSHPFR